MRGRPSPAHKRSPTQERELANKFGGQLVARSGAGTDKGDIKKCRGYIRIEAKTTSAKSFSVTRKMFEKIEEATMGTGEIPAIVIEFLGEDGKPDAELAVVPTYALNFIQE